MFDKKLFVDLVELSKLAHIGEVNIDSGDLLEYLTGLFLPEDFNSTNDENGSFDSRSDAKGPEPEAVTTGFLNGNVYGFIGLERVGGIVVGSAVLMMRPPAVTKMMCLR